MATIVRMPEALANATEVAIQGWLVSEGDTIAVGQPLAEIQTEKAMVKGVLVRLLVSEGDSVNVAALLAGEAGPAARPSAETDAVEGAPAGADIAPATPKDGATALESEDSHAGIAGQLPLAPAGTALTASPLPVDVSGPSASAPVEAASPSVRTSHRRFASPLVRRLARERSLDLSSVIGSWPNGRMVRRDLDGLVAPVSPTAVPVAIAPPVVATPLVGTAAAAPLGAAAAASRFMDIQYTGMRRAIARRLTESKSSVPHFYLTADCRVDRLLALCAEVNVTALRKISVNDFIVKAVTSALIDVPAANAIGGDDATRRFDHVDLSVAVSTDGGLLAPVLRGVDTPSPSAISASIADLAERARGGRLRQLELEGGSFAVSNLGMYGVDEVSAILNPPQSGSPPS